MKLSDLKTLRNIWTDAPRGFQFDQLLLLKSRVCFFGTFLFGSGAYQAICAELAQPTGWQKQVLAVGYTLAAYELGKRLKNNITEAAHIGRALRRPPNKSAPKP